ncbi:MAG: DNRLRE domain-containing protein, partial [Candidatus Thorarchaeota archaeon]|nr:DNRLRE domain-containing protein [Candidatus Thorarchaeota archaeon]
MKLKLAVTVMLLALLSLGTWGTLIMLPNATANLDAVKRPSRKSVLSDGDIVQMIIPVLEEEGVANSTPDTNYHGNIHRGGLFVGLEPNEDLVTRGWLKFDLAHVPKEVAIQSATLYAHLNDEYLDWDDEDAPIGVYYSPDSTWSETTITWNNQPSLEDTPSDFIDSPA